MDLGPNGEIDNDYFTPPGSPVIPDNGGMEIEDHSISDDEVNYDCNGAELTPDEDGEDGRQVSCGPMTRKRSRSPNRYMCAQTPGV